MSSAFHTADPPHENQKLLCADWTWTREHGRAALSTSGCCGDHGSGSETLLKGAPEASATSVLPAGRRPQLQHLLNAFFTHGLEF